MYTHIGTHYEQKKICKKKSQKRSFNNIIHYNYNKIKPNNSRKNLIRICVSTSCPYDKT